MIVDSGNRTEFKSGAVRDIQEGKGRCDLLPLDIIGELTRSPDNYHNVFTTISMFIETGDVLYLKCAIEHFIKARQWDMPTMLLEVAKHFEEGAKKYGERNWQKGIDVRCYIDSGIRHYLKFMRGDDDERHDRAFCWNILSAWWTCRHKPELNDYKKTQDIDKSE
jgi:hypothetical protein